MKQAVIKLGGSQYLVNEGQVLTIGKISAKKDENFSISDVYAVIENETATLGFPTVKNIKVEAKIQAQEKAEKIDVYKYKAKSRYRVHRGYRKPITVVKIEKISGI